MTEAEWLTTTDPEPMLMFLGNKEKGRKLAPDPKPMQMFCGNKGERRKLALFGVACCRRIPRLCSGKETTLAIELAERYGERKAKIEEVRTANRNAGPPLGLPHGDQDAVDRYVYEHAVLCNAAFNAMLVSEYAVKASPTPRLEQEIQCALLRELFGNPFRPARIRKEWRTSAVVALATGFYAEKAFERLPVLADALEVAGCSDPDILAHLRSEGPHVRGCWPVDVILGKK